FDAFNNAALIHATALEAQLNAQLGGRPADEFTHRVLHAGGDNEVLGLLLLQHHPLHAHVILGVAPVAQRVQVAHVQALLQALGNIGQAAGDLAGNESLAPTWRLVVEKNAVAGVHAIGLAVVHRDPVGVELGHRVGRA